MQMVINDNEMFKVEGVFVKVEYIDDIFFFVFNKFGIIFNCIGVDLLVEIKDLLNDVVDLFGFVCGVGDGECGKDVNGEIDDVFGICLKVIGGDIGYWGDVTYIIGFGDQFKDILLNFFDNSSGMIMNKLLVFDQDIMIIVEDWADLDVRMDVQEV